ncbi:hypothetical protein [Streptomyces echinatus]
MTWTSRHPSPRHTQVTVESTVRIRIDAPPAPAVVTGTVDGEGHDGGRLC